MKRFLHFVTIGCSIFLLLCVFIEFYQPKVLNRYSYKYNYMESQKERIKIMILGNSYMENAFNPKMLGEGTFELAMSGRWIYYDFKLLEKYIFGMDHLQVVLFGMGYSHPFSQSYNLSNDKSPANYDIHEAYMYDKFMNIKFDSNPFHWLGLYQGYINPGTLCDYCSCDSLGYEMVEGQSKNWTSEHNVSPDVIEGPLAMAIIHEYTEYLKDMAQLCQTHHVRFIVVTPPCHDSFNVNVRQEGLDILHGIIENVRAEYPIEYIDYLQDEEFRADSIYFNCSHLNSIGADMFALRVKKDFGL